MVTAAITAMGISIGADFALYLVFRIREELARGRPPQFAVETTTLASGKAIFFVASAVALGYLVLTLSGFRVWIHLGLLTAAGVALSAATSLV